MPVTLQNRDLVRGSLVDYQGMLQYAFLTYHPAVSYLLCGYLLTGSSSFLYMNHHRLHIDTWVPLPQHAVHALSENWIPVPPLLQTSIVHQTLEPNNIRRAYTDSVTQKRSQSHPGPPHSGRNSPDVPIHLLAGS